MRVFHVEDAEAGHVDATVTVGLQVDGHQVLRRGYRRMGGTSFSRLGLGFIVPVRESSAAFVLT